MKKILLIDDEETLLASLSDVIEAMGHEVYPYMSIREAISEVDLSSVDLVLCDVGLPNEDTFEFAGRVKSGHSDLPFIILSAFSDEDTIRRGLNEGADQYLVKPTSLKVLRQVFDSLP